MGCSDPWKENERKKKVGPAREAFHSPVWLHPCFFPKMVRPMRKLPIMASHASFFSSHQFRAKSQELSGMRVGRAPTSDSFLE